MAAPEVSAVRRSLLIIGLLVLSLVVIDQAHAVMPEDKMVGPYGGYCRGPRWGWYGAGKRVRSAGEVRALVMEFFRDKPLTVGEVLEREHFFEVQVLDAGSGELIDVLVIDKRNCRIRSKY